MATQREITEHWIARFEQSIKSVESEGPKDMNPALHKCYLKGLKSQLQDLKEELELHLREG